MDEYLSGAVEIVTAQVSIRVMGEEEIASMLKTLASSIRNASAELSNTGENEQIDEAKVKNSIRETKIICLECGQSSKLLSSRHLASHGLTAEQYREKHGLKPKTALAAKSLVRARKKKMQDMKLWERRKRKPAQTQKGKTVKIVKKTKKEPAA